MNKNTKLFFLQGFVFVAILGLFAIQAPIAQAQVCTSRVTRQCVSNIAYWYNSCGALESVAQNCNTTGQTCQNGQCVTTNTGGGTGTGGTTGTSHYAQSCYNNNLYWYSSSGMLQDLAQSCADTNSCTQDNCTGSQCLNELKCDGSTCAIGSQDYANYCQGVQNQPQNQISGGNVSISLFSQKEGGQLQWDKNLAADNGDNINFLLIVKNNSSMPVDNVLVKIEGSVIEYTGNLKINNLDSAGSVVSGISLGTMAPENSYVVSFTGKMVAQNIAAGGQTSGQVNAIASSNNTVYDSDFLTLTTNQTTATTGFPAGSLSDNLKKNWYIWFFVVLVLAIVFVIIFRKLSTNV